MSTDNKEEMTKQLLELEAANEAAAAAIEELNKEMNAEIEEDITTMENLKTAEATTGKKEQSIYEIIEEEGGPNLERINQWKEMYNKKVYVTYFEENDFYIYRYISRAEYKQIVSQFSNVAPANKTEELWDELIVQKALLFPQNSPELRATVPAGTFETLRKQIMINSQFMPDDLVLRMIQKL